MTRVWLVEVCIGDKWLPCTWAVYCDRAAAREAVEFRRGYDRTAYRVTEYVPKKAKKGKAK